MRKFYYLDNKKVWRGPYTYVQILGLCLMNKIGPFTYLWHDRLASDIGNHPSRSIYARLKASEYRAFPRWVFGSNLKVSVINRFKKISKIFKKNDWDRIAKTVQTMPAADAAATAIKVIPTLTSIHDFIAPGDFKVKLIYTVRNGEENEVLTTEYPIRLDIDQSPGIKYEITMAQLPRVGGVMHQESYGLHRHLYLKSETSHIEISKDNAFDFSTNFGYLPQTLRGRFSQANSITAQDFKQCYNRLIIKTGDVDFVSINDILDHNGTHWYDHDEFNIIKTLIGMPIRQSGQHTDVSFGNGLYRCYTLSENIIIVDGLQPQDLAEFKKHSDVVRVSLGMLTGKFYSGEVMYVSSLAQDFNEIDGVWYEMEKASVLSTRRIVELRLFRMTFDTEDANYETKYKQINKRIDPGVFSELCSILLANENIMRAASLVVTAMGNADPLQQGALYSVALETLTTELGEKKNKDLKPINDKALSDKLKKEILDVVKKYDAKLSEEAKVILEKKIAGLNAPTNRDKLVKTFSLYGVDLTEEDIATIDKRNSYLHGRNPLSSQQQFELTQISLRLHTIILSLMLKVAGYTGHVVNLDKAVYTINEEKMFEMIQEVEMNIRELTDKLKTALLEGNKDDFERLKIQLSELVDAHRLNNFIRII